MQADPRPERFPGLPRPPLWARWAITIVVFIVVIAVVAVIVRSGGGGATGTEQTEQQAVAEVNREADIAIAKDQSPHTASLPKALDAAGALESAISADVHRRIAGGELTGPLQSVRCRRSGSARDGRAPFRCTVRSAGITYPFLAVADRRTDKLTWCKRDPPSRETGSPDIPLSASCEVPKR